MFVFGLRQQRERETDRQVDRQFLSVNIHCSCISTQQFSSTQLFVFRCENNWSILSHLLYQAQWHLKGGARHTTVPVIGQQANPNQQPASCLPPIWWGFVLFPFCCGQCYRSLYHTCFCFQFSLLYDANLQRLVDTQNCGNTNKPSWTELCPIHLLRPCGLSHLEVDPVGSRLSRVQDDAEFEAGDSLSVFYLTSLMK